MAESYTATKLNINNDIKDYILVESLQTCWFELYGNVVNPRSNLEKGFLNYVLVFGYDFLDHWNLTLIIGS